MKLRVKQCSKNSSCNVLNIARGCNVALCNNVSMLLIIVITRGNRKLSCSLPTDSMHWSVNSSQLIVYLKLKTTFSYPQFSPKAQVTCNSLTLGILITLRIYMHVVYILMFDLWCNSFKFIVYSSQPF